jgi:hypothetical protein
MAGPCDADSGVAFVEHDIRYPGDILGDDQLTGMIDFSAPVAVLSVAVLHFLPDEDNPGQILEAFRSRMAPGSFLLLSHATSDGADSKVLGPIRPGQHRQQAEQAPQQSVDERQQHPAMVPATPLVPQQKPSSQHEPRFRAGQATTSKCCR